MISNHIQVLHSELSVADKSMSFFEEQADLSFISLKEFKGRFNQKLEENEGEQVEKELSKLTDASESKKKIKYLEKIIENFGKDNVLGQFYLERGVTDWIESQLNSSLALPEKSISDWKYIETIISTLTSFEYTFHKSNFHTLIPVLIQILTQHTSHSSAYTESVFDYNHIKPPVTLRTQAIRLLKSLLKDSFNKDWYRHILGIIEVPRDSYPLARSISLSQIKSKNIGTIKRKVALIKPSSMWLMRKLNYKRSDSSCTLVGTNTNNTDLLSTSHNSNSRLPRLKSSNSTLKPSSQQICSNQHEIISEMSSNTINTPQANYSSTSSSNASQIFDINGKFINSLLTEFELCVRDRYRVWTSFNLMASDTFNSLAHGTYRWEKIIYANDTKCPNSTIHGYLLEFLDLIKLVLLQSEEMNEEFEIKNLLSKYRLIPILQRLSKCPVSSIYNETQTLFQLMGHHHHHLF